eukprot:scaffold98291_cov64-Phaeocystis_antarctica.AAC.2
MVDTIRAKQCSDTIYKPAHSKHQPRPATAPPRGVRLPRAARGCSLFTPSMSVTGTKLTVLLWRLGYARIRVGGSPRSPSRVFAHARAPPPAGGQGGAGERMVEGGGGGGGEGARCGAAGSCRAGEGAP